MQWDRHHTHLNNIDQSQNFDKVLDTNYVLVDEYYIYLF